MPDARDFAIGEHFVEDAPVVTALRLVEPELVGDFSAAERVITGSGEKCLDFLANVRSHEFHDNTDTAARQEKTLGSTAAGGVNDRGEICLISPFRPAYWWKLIFLIEVQRLRGCFSGRMVVD